MTAESTARIRVIVVYKYPFVRDIVARVLEEAGLEVVHVVTVDDLASSPLEPKSAHVSVVDTGALGAIGDLRQYIDRVHVDDQASRVVLVSLEKDELIVYTRRTVLKPTIDALVEAVLGRVAESDLPTEIGTGARPACVG
jgi:hypothetical protein